MVFEVYIFEVRIHRNDVHLEQVWPAMFSMTRINLTLLQIAFSEMRRQTASCAYTLDVQSQTQSLTKNIYTSQACYKTNSTFKYFFLPCFDLHFNASKRAEEPIHCLFDDIKYVCVVKIVFKIFSIDIHLLPMQI